MESRERALRVLRSTAAIVWVISAVAVVLLTEVGFMAAAALGGTFAAWWGWMRLTLIHWCPRCKERVVWSCSMFCRDCDQKVQVEVRQEMLRRREEAR